MQENDERCSVQQSVAYVMHTFKRIFGLICITVQWTQTLFPKCEYVLQVYGIYCTPDRSTTTTRHLQQWYVLNERSM